MGTSARKKHRPHTTPTEGGTKGTRGQGYQRGRGRRHRLMRRETPKTEIADDSASQPADTKTRRDRETTPDPGPSTDDDGAPEVVSSKVPNPPSGISNVDTGRISVIQKPRVYPEERGKKVSQPKKPLRNLFASRSTLLRNVLGACSLLALIALIIR